MSDDVVVKIGGGSPESDHPEKSPEAPESHADPESGEPTAEPAEGKEEPTGGNETTTLAPTKLTSGALVHGKIITIKCADCGIERTIKPQDVFQVKRCPVCQKKFRNIQRSEARKAKREEGKTTQQ